MQENNAQENMSLLIKMMVTTTDSMDTKPLGGIANKYRAIIPIQCTYYKQ